MLNTDGLRLCLEALEAKGFALRIDTSFGQVDIVVETRNITVIHNGVSVQGLHDNLLAESMMIAFGFTEQHFDELMAVLQAETNAFAQQHDLTDYINLVLAKRAARDASSGLYKLLYHDMNIPFTLIEVREDNTICVYVDSPVHADQVPKEYAGVKVITIWRY